MNIEAALENADPKVRFAAIKHVARNKDVTMLKQLARVAEDDPDEQVRVVAAKAIDYIKADSRAEGAASSGPREVVVSAKDKARAKGYLDAAIGYQINGERERALREIAKALKVNPMLKHDQFFKSVLDEASGATGDEALMMVADPDQLEAVSASERERKQEKRKEAHKEDVSRSRWASVLMDLAIYTFLSIILTALGLGLIGQSAQGYLNNQEYLQTAFLNGERDEVPEIDPAFMEIAQQVAAVLTIPFSVMMGVIYGILGLISLLINLVFTHLAARLIFRGQATFPHLLYKVVSLYNARLPILYVILFVTIVLSFAMGGGIIPVIGSGILGLYSLMLFFKTIGRIGEAYDFGTGKGCLSFLVGSIILGVISFVVQLLFYGSLAAMIASQMAVS